MTTTTQNALSLRNLYLTRTAFQIVWALTVIATVTHPPLPAVLLILYPLWDVACTLYDLSSAAHTGPARNVQITNAIFGVAAAVGIGINVFHEPRFAVATFGIWALSAGLLQLGVALVRRAQLGGQWAMILSGAQSALGGTFYILGGLSDKKHIKDVAGYAIFGAVYFLIAAILMHRKLSKANDVLNSAAA